MKFTRNRRFERDLRASAEFRKGLRKPANQIKRRAEQASPHGDSGQTERSFVVTDDGDQVRVGNTDPFFHLTEFGSANNPPYASLRRGVRAAGLRLDETNR